MDAPASNDVPTLDIVEGRRSKVPGSGKMVGFRLIGPHGLGKLVALRKDLRTTDGISRLMGKFI